MQNGAAGSSAIYFEVEPGQQCGMHTHSAEEIARLLGGEAEVVVGGEKVGRGSSLVRVQGDKAAPHNSGHYVASTQDQET